MSKAKTIAVCGSSGCGKSMVSVAIAHELNKHKKSVIVISFDRTTPMFSSYLPFNRFEEKNSLGALLNGSIDAVSLKNKLHCNEKIKDTAFLAFGVGEGTHKFPQLQGFKIETLISLLSDYCDYIICDISSNFTAEKSLLATISFCQNLLILLSPDNMGLSFYDTYYPMLERTEESQLQIAALSNVFENYSPYETISKERNFKYILPHSKELYLSFLSGNMLTKACDESAKRFYANLEKIIERIEAYDGRDY